MKHLKMNVGWLAVLASVWFMSLLACADASTYYVGPQGNALCNGTKDVPFSVTDNVNCRYQTPTRAALKSGDTLIIDGAFNMTATLTLPSGTTIQGRNGAKLIGIGGLYSILSIAGVSNVIVSDVEITDASICQLTGPKSCDNDPSWARNGIYMVDASNILLKNVNIHGLAYRGIWWGRIKNVTLDHAQVIANSFAGIDGDLGKDSQGNHIDSSNSGDIKFINGTRVEFSGCGEQLNGTPYNCYSQSQTPTGYGDGVGEAATGGNWYCSDSTFAHNVSDGLDLLYHNGQGIFTSNNCHFEDNAGNDLKTNLKTQVISNSFLSGDCQYFQSHPQYVWKMNTDSTSQGFDHCRADGDSLSLGIMSGSNVQITNTQFKKNKHIAILTTGKQCDGTTKITVDNKTAGKGSTFENLPKYNYPPELSTVYYADGDQGGGPCKPIVYTSVESAQPPSTDTTPPAILNLTATPSDTTATIVWELSENATGQIAYGLTSNYNIFSDPETSFTYARHVQTLTNLTKATTYHYQIKSKDQAGNEVKSVDKTFTTTGATVCVPDHSCDAVACGKTCVDNCGTIIAGKPCPAGTCTITVPIACDQVKIGP